MTQQSRNPGKSALLTSNEATAEKLRIRIEEVSMDEKAIAAYIAQLTEQLMALAISSRLDVLAYLLGRVKLEALALTKLESGDTVA